MNKRKIIQIINGCLIAIYIIIVASIFYNIITLTETNRRHTVEYIQDVEQELEYVLTNSTNLSEDLVNLIDKYPMELIVQDSATTLFQTIVLSNEQQLAGVLNKSVVAIEGQGSIKGKEKELFIWYSIYNMQTHEYIERFMLSYNGVFLLGFVIVFVILLLLEYLLIQPVKNLRKSLEKVKDYNFDDIRMRDDALNIDFYHFADHLQKTINSASLKHTELEHLLQIERERLNSMITLSHALIHDLKSPVHQLVLENEYQLNIKKDANQEMTEILDYNIKQSEMIIREINNILKTLKVNNYEQAPDTATDLIGILLNTIKLFNKTFSMRRLILDMEVSESIIMKTNPVTMSLLLHNIVSNITQYADEDSEIKIIFDKNDAMVMMEFRNQTTQENLERMQKSENIFYAIEQEDDEHRFSSGNGLYLIKNLTKMLHGKYELYTIETEVIIYLEFAIGDENNE